MRAGVPDPDWPLLLSGALREGGVRAHHQPIVDVVRGAVVGYEALARFGDAAPTVGTDRWFEAARRLGRLPDLEAAALRAALSTRHELPVNTFLTVNLGPDVLDHPAVREVLAAEPSLAGVVVELTEHARVESYVALEPALDRLRGAGAMLAIDDMGSGYAGLQHLLSVRPDIIKLDRSLIAGVDQDETKRALVDMVGTFASRVDAWILAEGVETRPEVEALSRLGVPLAQGFYLGRPAPGWPAISELTATLLRTAGDVAVGPTLRALVEEVPTTTDLLGDTTGTGLTVLVDEHARPVAIVGKAGDGVWVHHAVLPVNVDTPVSQAAHRALTRAPEHRFRPLVCTDDAGRCVGVVRLERVLDHLATAVGSSPQDALAASRTLAVQRR